MNKLLHPLYGYPLAAWDFLCAIGQNIRLLGTDHQPGQNGLITADYFGVNIAPGKNKHVDEYLVERLHELGIRHVRMDYSYASPGGDAERLLEHLLGEGLQVTLDLLPPQSQAQILAEDPDAQQQWQRFLTAVFRSQAGRVAYFEIGNTPNRGKWSGFSSRGFIMATAIAHRVSRESGLGLKLVGPNVSDFEPLYNATYLRLLRRLDATPAIHSDNLFVERVVEPEAYDHRVLGWLARKPLKLNLVKKARILNRMGRETGTEGFFCTYTCWTIKRLRRRSAWPEIKRVDYLVRYLALAASSQALDRVYWGPLICSRDGLIDDGADDYPAVDQVSFYERIRGEASQFSPTPAYHALAYTARRLGGARALGNAHDPGGLSLFQYTGADNRPFLLAWTRDGQAITLTSVLPEAAIGAAGFHSATGEEIENPLVINEHPVFITLAEAIDLAQCKNLQGRQIRRTVHLSSPEWQSVDTDDPAWRGACMLRANRLSDDFASSEAIHPRHIPSMPTTRVLRDARNRLWNVVDPREPDAQITVKLNRVKGIKRFTYRFYPSKGRRHWNNACEMLRRGVATPLPLAFFESPEQSGVRDSWYLCRFIPDAFSSRDVYAAIRRGESTFRGLDKAAWLDLISGFVCHMHDMQVIHRDLSSGNLLLAQSADGNITPMVIDIGRARIWSGPGSRVRHRDRMLDLIRIAYKLDWSDRRAFIERYEGHLGRSLSPLWRVPFFYYDSKQRLKKALKGKRRRRR
ncbi:lipopolysaccharide kinase InaA family protein [Pseudohalioglobus lutimaris]|uniref:Protein kinase domain-containing protein n=1 Tax=Pseudohalioglobus lutimaris TaxID=1737061 RepID=A0A2N5X0Y7_9GAMM|nr:lipopolysaccharide kinase InaA family protein [Pseudohalioglobus lutimaris]PLW68120.1 hypothetical protein C0039_14290 [Pseudohalioglobus lutimaris]